MAMKLKTIFSIVGLITVMAGCGTGDNAAESTTTSTVDTTSTSTSIATEPESLTDREIADQFGEAVFRVEGEGCGLVSVGTAFAVEETTLVTNQHVVSIDTTPTIVSRDGERRFAEVIAWSAEDDLAVLQLDEPTTSVLEYANIADLTEGDDLVVLGYPLPEHDFSVVSGSLQSFMMEGASVGFLRTDAAVDYGNSGGPALTRTGQVAGVVTAVDPNPAGLQFVPLLLPADLVQQVTQDLVTSSNLPEVDCSAVEGGTTDVGQAILETLDCPEGLCTLAWPVEGDRAPDLPTELPGFTPDGPPVQQDIAVFGDMTVSQVFEFPYLFGDCALQAWTLRWRSVTGEAVNSAAIDATIELGQVSGISWDPNWGELARPATAGVLAGHGCSMPVWTFDDGNPEFVIIADLVVEYQVWSATP